MESMPFTGCLSLAVLVGGPLHPYEMQRRINYSGIQGIETQDRAMTEGMGYVCDRTQEHLGTSDLAVIAARRLLEKRAQELQKENARLKRLVADQALDNQILREAARPNW